MQMLPALPRSRCGSGLALAATLAWCNSPVLADTPADGFWHGNIAIGGSAASGNTSSTSLSITGDATRITDLNTFNVYGLINYGESKVDGVKTRTAELYRAGGKAEHNLSERLFVFGSGEGETNKPAGLDSRAALNAGVGYRVLRGEPNRFDVFTGAGYADSQFTDGSQRSGGEYLVGEESTHQFNESTSLKQRLVLYTGNSEVGERATFDATLTTAIAGSWTVNTGVAVRYSSKVAPGLSKRESLLTLGLGYSY